MVRVLLYVIIFSYCCYENQSSKTGTIPTDVSNALAETFKSDPDTHARIVWFLADRLSRGVGEPFIDLLQNAIHQSPGLFQRVANNIAKDTLEAQNNPAYREFLQDIWTNYLKDNLDKFQNGNQQWALEVKTKGVSKATYLAFMRAVVQLPKHQFSAVVQAVKTIGGAGRVAGGLASITSGAVGTVAIISAYLSYDVILNIRRWWNNEISGIRCVKNILDSGVSIAAGFAGGAGGYTAGAAIGGAIGGPFGATIGALGGAIFGGFTASITAQAISDRLTQWMFGLPRSEALENAYNFLRMSPTASNSDINSRFRELALIYHPDKNRYGDPDLWMRLQYSQALIKEARRNY